MDSLLITPDFGMKFIYKNTEYEIVSVYLDRIGISSVIAGHRKDWSRDFFDELIEKKLIVVTFSKSEIIKSSKVFKDLKKKYNYVRYALQNSSTPHNNNNLIDTIEVISKDINDISPPTTRTLSNWIRTYISNNFDIKSLIDNRKGNSSSRKSFIITQALSKALSKALNSPFTFSAEDIYIEIIQYLEENQVPYSEEDLYSLRQIQRLKKQHYDQFTKDKAKNSIRFAQNNCKASGQKIICQGFLNRVEIDSHQLDLVILDDETFEVRCRPWITIAIDIFTRIILGLYISEYPPNSYTTLQAMKNMVTTYGVPDVVIPDNGSEFINNSVLALARELQITLQPAQVKTPDNKPYIERFFRTLTHNLIQKIEGTTFSNRFHIEEYESKKYAALTLSQVNECLVNWIKIYHSNFHKGIGRVPMAKYNESTKSYRPIIIDEDYAEFICRIPHFRKISNGQIQYENLFYFSHALRTLELKGSRDVTIYVNESDLSKIYIKTHETDKIIEAISTDSEYTSNLTLDDHHEVQNIKKCLKDKDLKDYPYSDNVLARITLNQLIISYKKQNKLNRRRFIDSYDPLKFLSSLENSNSNKINKEEKMIISKIDFGTFDEFSYESLNGDHNER
ncbi:transposase [Acinetobacter sp. ANC 4635]|uniref:Mu transposase C-terminal domain-containing protein n=1 Tax=Acinetobacter sp. ANC 4635 TaxID=2529846 RepID=UPI00103F0766|nr:Mu transposase C-terminal domain-containing protein [Acinetobacter sp. ANC 4635]TCB33252.1 transposase [Acinetobacter sp. ANC 4635]